jgi:hypothetical protein
MKLLAMITDGKSVERYLTKLGEPTDVPARSASRGPHGGERACFTYAPPSLASFKCGAR